MSKKLIDKEALMAEIERRIAAYRKNFDKVDINIARILTDGKIEILKDILSFLDILEVKEEILDKEGKTKLMQKCVHEAYQRGYDMGVLQTTNKINHNTKEVDLNAAVERYVEQHKSELNGYFDIRRIARHFFELGLNAKGE